MTFAPERTSSAPAPMPRATDFAELPSSWYLFGLSGELDEGPRSKSILGRQLVAFRTAAGRTVVMDGRCSHLGADLGKGKIVGEAVECPFHGWRYGPDGRCTHIPTLGEVPARARQRVYPAAERHGMLFFFAGAEPLFPLPFFPGEQAEAFVAAPPVKFVADCAWYMVAAHGFDTQHFETVHARRLLGPLAVDRPDELARRSRYRAEVLGHAYYDRLLRRFAGRTVEISITTWGGTIVMITGDFQRARSRFMIVLEPIPKGKTLCRVVAFARRRGHALGRLLLQPLDLWVRRLFTGGYLLAESDSLGSPSYNPHSLIETDREMIDYFRWAATLPASAPGPWGGTEQCREQDRPW